MKALDELRSISDGCAYNEDDCRQWRSCREHRAQLLDAIEREIAERYQPLPVDADGVPWHIGDRTESGQTIEAMGLNKHGWYFVGTVNEIDPAIHRHYHAPTVEDVLREFATEVYADADNEIRDRDFLCAKYAKRLKLAEGEGE